jgi:hypothetical protein
MEDVGPVDDGVECGGQSANGLETLIRMPAGVGKGHDVVAAKDADGDTAELGESGGMAAVEFIDAEAELAAEAGRGKLFKHLR